MRFSVPEPMRARLAEYGGFHRSSANEVCHFLGIPSIVAGAAALLSLVPLAEIGGTRLTLALLVGLAIVVFYVVAARSLGVVTGVLFGGLVLAGQALPWTIGLALFLGGWALQFLGHVVFEHQSPAFLRNLLHLLIGPAWLVERAFGRSSAATLLRSGPKEVERLDALVLLGCRVTARELSPPARRRVERAAHAFQAGVAPRLVVSGGRSWDGHVEADRLSEALERQGVPRTALVLERASRRTRENARFSAPLLRALGASRIGVVTCDFHLPRALWSFRHEGFIAVPIGAISPEIPASRRTWRFVREQAAWILDRVAS